MPDGGTIHAEALRGYVTRVAHLHDERDTLNADIREIYKEAKEAGFDTTILREIVREFRVEADARSARYLLLETYRNALGMLGGTPLGDAAIARAEGDAIDQAIAGAEKVVPYPAKSFDQQPVRRRGRPRRDANGHDDGPQPAA